MFSSKLRFYYIIATLWIGILQYFIFFIDLFTPVPAPFFSDRIAILISARRKSLVFLPITLTINISAVIL